jgi:CPA1 family monovalent cation:H+ antiporter
VLLGIVVAVFDTRLFHEAEGRPHVPRALADALKTREMLSRITALACFALTVNILRGGPMTPLAALGVVAYELVGGAVAGAVIGWAVVWVRGRVDPAPVEIAVSIATPYLGALAAEALGVSMVAVVIVSALVVSAVRIDARTGAPHTSAEARISATAFWEEASLILSAVLFFLTGWALPRAMSALGAWPFWWLMGAAAVLLAATVAIQALVSFAAAALPGGADELGAERRSWRFRAAAAGAMAWASTRSVIGLVVALSIPTTRPDGSAFAERDLILVLAALVIVGSILLQGLTLRAVVRRAGLADPIESKEEAAAERALAEAMRSGGFPQARRTLLERRARNDLGDETLRKLFRELDLRERAAEPSALPGAGPPNP